MLDAALLEWAPLMSNIVDDLLIGHDRMKPTRDLDADALVIICTRSVHSIGTLYRADCFDSGVIAATQHRRRIESVGW